MTSIAVRRRRQMGYRLAKNLKGSRYDVRHVEISDVGKARLKDDLGLSTVDVDVALDSADVVILAVPDTHIGKVAAGISDKLKAGTMVIALDAAAPFAGHFPERPDLTCSSRIRTIRRSSTMKPTGQEGPLRRSLRQQHIVSALVQGRKKPTPSAKKSPRRSGRRSCARHRVTVEQMAMLEPGLSETVAASLLVVMKQAMDECVARGRSGRGCPRLPARPPERSRRCHLRRSQGRVLRTLATKAIEFGIPA